MLAERESETWPLPSTATPCVEMFGSDGPEYASKYYRARYYDPTIGRFISEDPIGLAGGVNVYGYALASPARYRDPSGLDIYYLIDRSAAAGAGHGALLIGNDHDGYLYQSFAGQHFSGSSPSPSAAGNYDEKGFDSFQAAISFLSDKSYDEYLKYNTNRATDLAAVEAAQHYGRTNRYVVTTTNCQEMVNTAMFAARVPFDGRAWPNLTFKFNIPAADSRGTIR